MIEWRSHRSAAGMLADILESLARRLGRIAHRDFEARMQLRSAIRRLRAIRRGDSRLADQYRYQYESTSAIAKLAPRLGAAICIAVEDAISAVVSIDETARRISPYELDYYRLVMKYSDIGIRISRVVSQVVAVVGVGRVPKEQVHAIEGRWRVIDFGLTGRKAEAFLTAWSVDPEGAVELAEGWSEWPFEP